ncbi:MAG: LCP family protein [Clostridia bacterium]|nr:LCP family protein [Clostridia bacterium]
MDPKEIQKDIETGGAAAQPSEISLASMDTPLEALPEVASLTQELLVERKAAVKSTSGGKNKKRKSKKASAKASHPARSSSGTDDHADSGERFETTVSEKKPAAAVKAEESGEPLPVTEPAPDETPSVKETASVSETTGVSEPAADQVKPAAGRRKRIIVTAVIAVAVLVVGLIVWEGVRLAGIVNSVNFVKPGSLFGDTETVVSESVLATFVSHSDDTKNVLLIGYDIDENGRSRSDSMILVTLDHQHRKIKMTSFMRDMYVTVPGYGHQKMNSSFAFGGPELVAKTIYANFGLQVDKYVCVDYKAFVDVVNEIGGIQIDLEEMELEQFNKYVGKKESNKIYEAGSYVMNGKQTLTYCRIRKVGSDTMRTARQREVLGKIMKKCENMSLLELEHLLRVTAPNVTTNLSLTEIFQLAAEGLSSKDYDIQGLRIPVGDAWYDLNIGGVSYVGIDVNATARCLSDFLYGDEEKANELVEHQQKVDDTYDEWERARYERKKARENRG